MPASCLPPILHDLDRRFHEVGLIFHPVLEDLAQASDFADMFRI
jgi:hypothetical protein